jgi:EAL and modified HD-GYP domain-containing signal transduction protein
VLKQLASLWSGHPSDPTPGKQAKPPVAANAEHHALAHAKSGSVMRREAMLGRDLRVAAYTFMLRRAHNEGDAAPPEMQSLYDQTLIDNLQRMDISRLLVQRLAFVPVAPVTLLDAFADAWPNASTVWELLIGADTVLDAELMARLNALKTSGKRFAVGFAVSARSDAQALLQLAEYVLMDVSGEDLQQISAQLAAVSRLATNRRFVATSVRSLEAYHMCHKLQFSLFMGSFITSRDKLDSPLIVSSRAKVLDLMNRVRNGVEQNEIAEQFRHDPTLSVRLLSYVNSPGMGLLRQIGSIEQALMVMGQDKLYRWLTLILFTGGQAQELDRALLENALVRARLAEQLATHALFAKAREEVFVTGLFSLLDVVMRMPMEKLLKQIVLPSEISDAILHNSGPYAPYLALAIACENEDQAGIEVLSSQIRRDMSIDTVHMDALLWAQQLLDV